MRILFSHTPFVCFFSLLLSPAVFPQPREDSSPNFERGVLYLGQGKTQEARSALLRAFELNEPAPELYSLIGQVLEQSKEDDLAIEVLEEGTRRFPAVPEIFSELGHFYLLQSRFDEGIQSYEKAMRLSGQNKEDVLNLATAHYRKGLAGFRNRQYFDSLVSAKKAIRLAPENAGFYHLLGVSYFALGQSINAKEAFGNAIALDPGNAAYYYDLGVTHSRLGDSEEAVKAFQKTIELNPDFSMAYLLLGRIYHNQKKTKEALHCFEQALEKDPDLQGVHYHIGFSHKALGEDEQAIREMEKEVDQYPDYLPARKELGALYLRRGNGDAALLHLQHALAIEPQDPGIRFLLGKALFEVKRPSEALESFSEASRLDPSLPEPHYWKAQILMKQGKQDLAKKELERFTEKKKTP